MKTVKMSFILIIAIIFISCNESLDSRNPNGRKEAIPFRLDNWDKWGNIKIVSKKANTIVINGRCDRTSGYVVERDIAFSNNTLVLSISNSSASQFDHKKMFKLEINNKAIRPIEKDRININDPEYINSGDGRVSFRIPIRVQKIQLIFYNAVLKDLEISYVAKNK